MTPCTPAEALARSRHAVLSHESAARAWDIELLLDTGRQWLTVPRNASRLIVPGWRVRRHDLPPEQLDVLPNGMRVTVPAQTVLDLARVLPTEQAVVVADSALRRALVSVGVLTHVLTSTLGPGTGGLRVVAAMLDPASGSVLETLLRLRMLEAGLRPLTQYEIHDERGYLVARVDFCWPAQRLVVEADGFAFHSDRMAYRRDRQRMNELERLGWRVLRFTYEDVRSRPLHVIGLITACLADAA